MIQSCKQKSEIIILFELLSCFCLSKIIKLFSFNFGSNLLSSPHTSLCIKGINQEVMTAYTSNSESTSTGLQFKAAYVTLMLHQGAPGNLFFEGANVSEFLDRFENMYDEYRMSTSEKICNLPWYCKMFTARHIRSVIGFSELD